MALTKNDLQLIREILRPEFEKIAQEFKRIDNRFEDQNKRMLGGFKEIVIDVFDSFSTVDERLDSHEERITKLEVQN